MKLYSSTTSPYARKVTVFAHETGLASRIELSPLRPLATKTDAVLSQSNPLSKIPTLILDDGTALYDSPVCCEYLDSLHGGARIIPAEGPARWEALRLQALCDGILDAAVLVFYEHTFRPKELHWAPWLDGQAEKARQGLDALEAAVKTFGRDPLGTATLPQMCAGVTLGWLEFRNVLGDIRTGRAALFAWYETFRTRASMATTAPRV
jgi:glutathione S-transferase